MAIVGHVAVKFTGNSTGFVDSVRQAIAALAGLNKALYDSEAAGKIFGKALTAISPHLTSFSQISAQTATVLKNQSAILGTVANSFTKLDAILTKIGGASLNSLNGVAGALNKVAQAATHVGQTAPTALNNVNNALGQTQSKMKSVETGSMSLRTALGSISAGFAAKTIISSFADFEHQLNQVLKLVKPEEFGKVTEAFRQISTTVPLATSELSSLAQELVRMGVPANEFSQALKTASDLQLAMGTSATETLIKIARFNSVLGEGHDKLRETANIATNVSDALTTNQTEIMQLASRWAQSGKAIGLNKEQIIAWSGAMRAANINAEAGGTAMSELAEVIAAAVTNGGKELQTLAEMTGLTREAFVELQKTDPSQLLQKFFMATSKLANDPGGLTTLHEKLDVLGLDSQRISRVLQQTGGAVDVYGQAIAAAGIKTDTLAKQMQVATQGMSDQWKILMNTLKTVSNVLLSDVGGAITKTITQIRDLVAAILTLDPATVDAVKSLVSMGAEFLAIIGTMYTVIKVAGLVRLAFLSMTPAGWAAAGIAGLITLRDHLQDTESWAHKTAKAMGLMRAEANEARKAQTALRQAEAAGADEKSLIEQVRKLKEGQAKLAKEQGGDPGSQWAQGEEIKKQLKEIETKYQNMPALQIEIKGLDTVEKYTETLDGLKKKKEEIIESRKKSVIHFEWGNTLANIDKEIKKNEDLIVVRKKYDTMVANPPKPLTVQETDPREQAAAAPTPAPAPKGKAAPTAVAGMPPTESQKLYNELAKSLEIVEKKFKATGDEEDRLREKSKHLKKALDDIAAVNDDTAKNILTKVGQQYKENEAALDKYTNVTKKAIKDSNDFKATTAALTREQQLLGVTTESIQTELNAYESRLREVLKAGGDNKTEVASLTAKIKELQTALADSKAADAQKKIMETLNASFDNAAIHGGTYADKVNAIQQRITALNTAHRALIKLLGETSPAVKSLADRITAEEEALAQAKGEEKYADLMDKIKLKTVEAEEEFGALGDTQAYLKSQVDIATFSLLGMYKIFGEGSPQVQQARDDLISAANAMDIWTTGKTKLDAAMKVADKNAKEEEKVWKKLADTIMGVSDQIGEALGNMVIGVKTTKEEYKQTLKELLKIIIKFVIQAVAQFIILSIVGGAGGAGGTIGQRLGQSFSTGLTGNFVTSMPAKAQGGVLTRPTVSRLAERGPEAVIPLQNGTVPVSIYGGMNTGMDMGGPSDHPFEVTIINVVEKGKAESMARDKKAIINTINEDLESRGSVYRSVKGVAKAR